MITLYGMSSPNVRKVVILLEELGLDYRLDHVRIFREAQFDPEFVALNPFAKVPVLVDDRLGADCPIFESGAILFYLAEAYGRFLPEAGKDRYAVMKWLMAQMGQIGPMFGQHNHFQTMPTEANPYSAARYKEQARRLYVVLDKRLGEAPWLAGTDYSIADIATFPWVSYAPKHGFDWADLPDLARWHQTIAAREAVQRADKALAQSADIDAETRKTATVDQIDSFFGRTGFAVRADQAE